jgi:hypothetical protein
MLKRFLLVVSLGMVLALALTSVGCASGSGLRDMLAKVPSGTTSLKYVDVKALRNDDDLDDLYDAWRDSVSSTLEALGIGHSDVNTLAHGLSTDVRFTLLVGQFDLDEVRDALDDRDYDKDQYGGVEVWEKDLGWSPELESRVALMDDLIILGNEDGVEGCIEVIKDGESSWLSRTDIKDVTNRLAGGLYVDLQRSELAGLLISGLEATGISAKKQDSDTLSIAGVAKFDDEDDADDAKDAIEELMDLQFNRVDITQEGLLLEASAELDIDDAESLFQGT